MLGRYRLKANDFKVIVSLKSRFSTAEAQKQEPEWNKALPYAKLPGPSALGLIRAFLPGGKYHNITLMDLGRALKSEYGDIVRVQGMFGREDLVFTFRPEIYEKMFRNEGIYPQRRGLDTFTYYRQVLRPDIFHGRGGLLTEHGEKWYDVRTKVNPVMLKPNVVRMYVTKVDKVGQDFIDKIRVMRNKETNEVNEKFGFELNKFALESIGVIALDERLGVLSDDLPEAQRIIESLKNLFVLIYELDIEVSIWKYYATPKYKELMNVFDVLTITVKKYIDRAVERLDAKAKTADDTDISVLEKLLSIDRHIAIVMVLDMLLAGVDTTSSALVSCLYQLSKNPSKQARLREEVLKYLPTRSTELRAENLNHMSYLKACVKEALRLNPIATGNARTTVQNTVLEGYQIPKGVDVIMDLYWLQRNPSYFKDPETFLPERWLREGSEASKLSNPFVYLPFGFGPRSCIGRRFAEMEIYVMLSKLVRNFNIEYNYGPLKYSRKSIILSPDEDVKFKLTDLDI